MVGTTGAYLNLVSRKRHTPRRSHAALRVPQRNRDVPVVHRVSRDSSARDEVPEPGVRAPGQVIRGVPKISNRPGSQARAASGGQRGHDLHASRGIPERKRVTGNTHDSFVVATPLRVEHGVVAVHRDSRGFRGFGQRPNAHPPVQTARHQPVTAVGPTRVRSAAQRNVVTPPRNPQGPPFASLRVRGCLVVIATFVCFREIVVPRCNFPKHPKRAVLARGGANRGIGRVEPC
mmetsp:Transcript_4980/g.18526  ORF Transcript_4980/g.18526 Transcript_4980/m.18526 type:complete len:233 (+) Transcript_4980:2371-3069(+)